MCRFENDCLHQQHNYFQQALITEIVKLFQLAIAQDYANGNSKRHLRRAKMV